MLPTVNSSPPPIGVALAGGRSSRMGRDKTAIAWRGATLLEHTVERLRAVCGEVLVADGGRGPEIDGTVAVPDGPGAGPVAGILGAAAARPGRSLLVLACDLPHVPAALLAVLVAAEGDWVVPHCPPRGIKGGRHRRSDGLEPLASLLRPKALAALAGLVERGVYAVHRLAEERGLAVRGLERAELAIFGPPEDVFLNVNRPADLARALRRAEATDTI